MNQTIIIINPYCHQGRGWKTWLSIKQEVLKQLPSPGEIVTEKGEDLAVLLDQLITTNKETCLISAGGDGSMHYLVNGLMNKPGIDFSRISIGAIGLGSSNDFLKPFKNMVGRIPVRINTTSAALRDLGMVEYKAEDGGLRKKYFIVNASVGVTAEANWYFNNPGKILKWLKKTNTGMAIGYTAISTILSYRNRECNVRYEENELKTALSNVNILKIPYVSGSFHYTQDIRPDDGLLGLNLCLGMNKRELLQTLSQLSKGKFTANAKRTSLLTNSFGLHAEAPIIFECDGETEKATEIRMTVMPKAINVLQE